MPNFAPLHSQLSEISQVLQITEWEFGLDCVKPQGNPIAVWEPSSFSCVFPFIAPPLSCLASGILPKETQDVSVSIQVDRA